MGELSSVPFLQEGGGGSPVGGRTVLSQDHLLMAECSAGGGGVCYFLSGASVIHVLPPFASVSGHAVHLGPRGD